MADEAKRRIAAMARKTFTRGVLAPIGGFGALFQLDGKRWREQILVSSADGVGTKLKIAFATGIHSTVGADILNHCINDILTQGAQPLFFLDYLAMGKIDARIVEQVIEGMSRAARHAGCALIGGETAEMPDFYTAGEYDLAGFIVGAVERKMQLDPRGCVREMRCWRCRRADCTRMGIHWRGNWGLAWRSSARILTWRK